MKDLDVFQIRQVLGIIKTRLEIHPNSSEFKFYLGLKEQLERVLQDIDKGEENEISSDSGKCKSKTE